MDLDLCRAEMEIEHQTHQREEKALRAQVIEAEERRKVAVQEALKKVEAMKKECDGIPSSFILYSFFFLFFAPIFLTFFYCLEQPFKKISRRCCYCCCTNILNRNIAKVGVRCYYLFKACSSR
jgi:hypothetical protein